jgi:Mg-chelatase subunit ChlD
MSDENKLDKPIDLTFTKVGGKLSTKAPAGSFKDRVMAGKQATTNPNDARANAADAKFVHEEVASQVLNRVALMLDCSGSMSGYKNQNLHTAVSEYIKSCNFTDTSIAIRTFGKDNGEIRGPLSRDMVVLEAVANTLPADGGTPLLACFADTLESISLTRGVIISDGQAGDWRTSYSSTSYNNATLEAYVEAGIPVDCVHIGNETGGEDLLRHIAERTGGIFVKFKDSGNFAKAFKYLSPANRALLGDGSILRQLGASEVR